MWSLDWLQKSYFCGSQLVLVRITLFVKPKSTLNSYFVAENSHETSHGAQKLLLGAALCTSKQLIRHFFTLGSKKNRRTVDENESKVFGCYI